MGMHAIAHFYEQHQARRQQWLDTLPLFNNENGQCSPKSAAKSRSLCSEEQIDAVMREVGAPLRFRIANEYNPASGGESRRSMVTSQTSVLQDNERRGDQRQD